MTWKIWLLLFVDYKVNCFSIVQIFLIFFIIPYHKNMLCFYQYHVNITIYHILREMSLSINVCPLILYHVCWFSRVRQILSFKIWINKFFYGLRLSAYCRLLSDWKDWIYCKHSMKADIDILNIMWIFVVCHSRIYLLIKFLYIFRTLKYFLIFRYLLKIFLIMFCITYIKQR